MNTKMLLLAVLVIDMVLFFGQTAAANINPGGTVFWHANTSIIADAGDPDTYTIGVFNETSLPGTGAGVDTTDGSSLLNVFRNIKNWFLNLPGISYVNSIVNALPRFLAQIGLPQEIVFGIGAMWHVFSIFALISFIWGRE